MDEIKEVIVVEQEKKKLGRQEIMQIIFLVLILITVAALVAAVVTVHRYSDMLANPLGYNLAQFKLQSCACIDNFGKFVDIVAINKTS